MALLGMFVSGFSVGLLCGIAIVSSEIKYLRDVEYHFGKTAKDNSELRIENEMLRGLTQTLTDSDNT
jgi:hypothetical protein